MLKGEPDFDRPVFVKLRAKGRKRGQFSRFALQR